MLKATQETGKELSKTFMAGAKRYETEQGSGASDGGRGDGCAIPRGNCLNDSGSIF